MRLYKKKTLYKAYVSVASLLLFWFIKLYFFTLRIRVEGKDVLKKHLVDKNAPSSIIALWHNQLLFSALLRKLTRNTNLSVVISKSRDGDVASRFAQRFTNFSVIRVGHKTRHKALKEMVAVLEKGSLLIITPDGPRGPCYQLKPGVFYCAEKARANIIPMRWTASRSLELNSWDKFRIPYPFSIP